MTKDNLANPLATSSHGAHISGTTEARILGSAVAGMSELFLFHPVDTIAKRLMTNETRQVVVMGNMSLTVTNLNHVLFKGAAERGFGGKMASLFPGIGFGAAYTVSSQMQERQGKLDYIHKLMT